MRTKLLFLSICGLIIGCSSNSPFDYVKVSGRVTYEDGTPIPAGSMLLHFAALDAPQLEGAFPRPARADVNSQGEFNCATSYKYGDGLIPGRHKVAIEVSRSADGKLLVPKQYTTLAATPLVVDTEVVPLEITVPKPSGNQKR